MVKAFGENGRPGFDYGQFWRRSLLSATASRALAERVAPDETDSWRLAQALEQAAYEAIETKDFSQAFATAAEVAKDLQGDCTEHAVLLAALCRARNIPSRVAIGLVYYPAAHGYAYHMWNEVWIENGWIPLDATLGMQGTGVGHLKLSVLDDAQDAFGLFGNLAIVNYLGQLRIEVLECR